MSTWSAITSEQLGEEVAAGVRAMRPPLVRLWDMIRVDPVKWQLHPWGDQGGGFWVVAMIGNQVLWYNDIEEGFNWSTFTCRGEIDNYVCNQDELHHAVYLLLDYVDTGRPMRSLGPPGPLPTADA